MPTNVAIAPMVELLREEWAAIDELCEPLGEADWALPTCLPGWTVQDQLAHIAGIEMMLDGAAAPEVDVSHLTHLRNDVARMGEVWVEDMRSSSGAEVLRSIPLGHLASARCVRRHEPGRLRRTVVDAGRQGRDLRALHAHPSLRLLPARARHP